MKIRYVLVLAAGTLCLTGWFASSQEEKKDRYASKIAKASKEGQLAIKRIQVPKGMQVNLTAAEPLLANPIAFYIDDQGRFYVAETFRLHRGVTDNRSHRWTTADLSSRTVADRLAMYRKYLGKKFASYGKDEDRIRLLVDTNGDGKLDKAMVFADGFSRPEAGLGSGVLARNGKVWYTDIPHLWLLEDKNGDGRADVKKSLHNGFGVHVSFLGHDSHGLIFGPDGKLYFSIGDRGFHVVINGKTLSYPDTGTVLRCNPDGSELEVVASGFRNPQELAFDEFGNLFTGDNNADSGDQARWVYVVEGGDSGWRIGYQYLKAPPARLGPWNAEKLWHKRHLGQPAYIVPPIDNIASGPSGLTYNPGVTLLPEKYQRHFFLCDFRGGPGNSGIHTFQMKPKGATFELINRKHFAWNVLATDADFGPDGGLYLTDWVSGWGMPMKGRIYKVFDPGKVKNAKVAEVKKLLAEGMEKRSTHELQSLLGHQDMRIRLRAQFALANRKATKELGNIALSSKTLLARLHALWGLEQIGAKLEKQSAKESLAKTYFVPVLKDSAAEVRAQAAKVLGALKANSGAKALLPLLKDDSARVRFFAAMALGKIGDKSAIQPVLDMLGANNDEDAYLRHAGVMALTWIGDRRALIAHAKDSSRAVRLGVLLAMRRLEMPAIAGFLDDADAQLVLEAARAINDVPINAAMPQLAAMAGRTKQPDALTYRALNAHFRLGGKDNAQALAQYAARSTAPEDMRLEALRHLGNWAKPPVLDRVMGLYRPLEPRSNEVAAEAMRSALGGIFTGPNRIHAEAARVAAKLGIKQVGPTLFKIVMNKERPAEVRVESLRALEMLKDNRVQEATKTALRSDSALLRAEGRRVLAKQNPKLALAEIQKALRKGELIEQQGAFAVLGKLKLEKANGILENWMDRLLAGKVQPALQLDLVEAAAQRKSRQLQLKLKQFESGSAKKDVLGQYRLALFGGNAKAGQRIFLQKSEVSCVRCHKINGTGGDVGPDLSHIAKEKNRDYLLEAIVAPSKQIAKGFDSVILVLKDGRIKNGILKSENKNEVRLMTAEGTILTVPTASIDERLRGKSAMPEDIIQHLSRRELRDLVEYLSSLR